MGKKKKRENTPSESKKVESKSDVTHDVQKAVTPTASTSTSAAASQVVAKDVQKSATPSASTSTSAATSQAVAKDVQKSATPSAWTRTSVTTTSVPEPKSSQPSGKIGAPPGSSGQFSKKLGSDVHHGRGRGRGQPVKEPRVDAPIAQVTKALQDVAVTGPSVSPPKSQLKELEPFPVLGSTEKVSIVKDKPQSKMMQSPTSPPKSQIQAEPTPSTSTESASSKASQQTIPSIAIKVAPSAKSSYKPMERGDKYGTKGRKILLKANFFELEFRSDVIVYHYDIEIKPTINSKEKIRSIVDEFVNSNKQLLFNGISPVFDGRKNLYTNKPLNIQDRQAFKIKLKGDSDKRKPFELTLKRVATISLSSLFAFFNKKLKDYPQDAVQSLDVVLREANNHRFIPLQQYFFTSCLRDVPMRQPGLELWSGVFQSVRPAWQCLMLQVDSSVRVFHKGQRVIDLCAEFFGCRVDELNSRPMNDKERADFESHIKGLQVEIDTVRYKMLMPRTYKLVGLSRDIVNSQTFPMSQPDGTEKSTKVINYFKDTYKLNLEFTNLHCLQAQPADKHRYIPMELCVVKKGQQLKKLSEELVSQLIRYSAVAAPNREKNINDAVREINYKNDEIAKAYGLAISDKMVEFEGRVLPAPSIEYFGNKKVLVKEGCWNMENASFYTKARVRQMALIHCARFNKPSPDNQIRQFIEQLIKTAKDVGLDLPPPANFQCVTRVQELEKEMVSLSKTLPGLDLIIVILSEKNNDVYGEVKRIGDLVIGIATQCIQQITYQKKLNVKTLSNICLKINAKLGETNSIIDSSMKTPLMSIPVMIMGADVTHPTPGDTSNPSIAAITGSYDAKACRYAARIKMQGHRVEIITELDEVTKDLINNFQKKTNCLPKRIYYYRDGVSEGQFKEVLSSELQAIQRACFSFGEKYQPAITFITVQKRHHTRLFAKDRRDQVGKSQNVPAGTTVDTAIVHPIDFDFYLCSHQGIQGTSRPAHYYVLYDDSKFSADELQDLTYRLCHVYVRCTRSVSIPAPVYYAHHAAFRGRYYLDRLGKSGKLPENTQAAEKLLKQLNDKCIINEKYPGMFFA